MKINHRITARTESPFWKEVQNLGLPYEPGMISVLNITEDHEAWPKIECLLVQYDLGPHFIDNLFTQKEIEEANWLKVGAKGQHGYPQPEDGFGYIEQTYDTTDFCRTCGIGKVQKAPFRLRQEPKAEHSHFLQLNWVFDELFIRPEVRSVLEETGITGVSFIPPILHKKNQPSESVVQMKVDTILAGGLDTSNLQTVTCRQYNEEDETLPLQYRSKGPYCHRIKYHIMRKGPFKFDCHVFNEAPDVVKSREWFGSGGSAHQLLVVSRRFREIVLQRKWRGIYFEPIELVNIQKP